MSKLEVALQVLVIKLCAAHKAQPARKNILIWQLSPKHFVVANHRIIVSPGEKIVTFPGLQLPNKIFSIVMLDTPVGGKILVWWNVEIDIPTTHKGKQIWVKVSDEKEHIVH